MPTGLLVIDDEPSFLAIIERTAKAANVPVQATTDPEEFKRAVLQACPLLILLDLQMPDSDGIELLHFLAHSACRAKIVLMSGFDTRVLALARGMGDELGLDMGEPLQKPVRPADLRELFSKLRVKSFAPDADSLRCALAEDQLDLYYHPLVSLKDGMTVGFEALVRWRHPEVGLVMPDRFIGLAEREQLIGPLTDRVIEMAIARLGSWRTKGFAPFLSVNFSAANIVDAQLPDRLSQLCKKHKVPPGQLCIELTETAAMGDAALMLEVLTRIRLKGFKLAIDDFGTGYSSLLQLHRLPFSELKIDQSFVRTMARSEEAAVIVGAIVSLAHALKLELIAEGIEDESTLMRLAALGCQTGQGYYFTRPFPAENVPEWMAGDPRPIRAAGVASPHSRVAKTRTP